MNLYDPLHFCVVPVSDCTLLAEVNGAYSPVLLPSGRWSALGSLDGRLTELENLPAPTRAVMDFRIAVSESAARVRERIESMRLLGESARDYPPHAVEAVFGPLVFRRVSSVLRDEGYSVSEIHHATATIDSRMSPSRIPPDSLDEGVQDKHILKAVFLAGAGGSGKSFLGEEAFAGEGLKVINQDKHLERLLSQHGVPLKDAGSRYDLFNQARDLKNKEQKLYSGRRLGMIVDSTGWAYDRIAGPVEALRNLGYDVSMVFVSTSLESALRRNRERGESGGRTVPDSYIKDAWEGAHDNIGRYRKLFGKRFFIVDNDQDMSPQKAEKTILPAIRSIGKKILSMPLENPKGKEWLARGAVPDVFSDEPESSASKPKSYTAPNQKVASNPDALKLALAAHNAKTSAKDPVPKIKFPKGKPVF